MKSSAVEIPQIAATTQYPKSNKIKLTKNIRQYLNSEQGQKLYVKQKNEIILKTELGGLALDIDKGGCILPQEIANALSLQYGEQLALVERPQQALALKRIEIISREGSQARYSELETDKQLIRVIETNPLPETALPNLKEKYADTKLDHSPINFIANRQNYPAWQARQVIEQPDVRDRQLRQTLIDERISRQASDGSWKQHVLLTARNVRELSILGLETSDPPIERAANWILDRPQSPFNPGMFFGSDELVAVQAEVIAQRRAGQRERFRQLKASEKKRVMAGDELIENPCGPRIMWPNALVLEALLQSGYEEHPRLQTAIRFFTSHDWCECGYQHGDSDHAFTTLSEEQVAAFEAMCVEQYRFGGIASLQSVLEYPRISYQDTSIGIEYELAMPDHVQGCEFITTRALSQVADPLAQRFARAHLWRFAGHQRGPGGKFPAEHYGTGFSQAGILDTYARYDLPIAQVVILNAIPWIIVAQNEDGSWGKDDLRDSHTLAILRALNAVREYLPDYFLEG